jgi:hypothetical protein
MNINEMLDELYESNEAQCTEVEMALATYAIRNFKNKDADDDEVDEIFEENYNGSVTEILESLNEDETKQMEGVAEKLQAITASAGFLHSYEMLEGLE